MKIALTIHNGLIKKYALGISMGLIFLGQAYSSAQAKSDENTILLGAPLSITGHHSVNGKHVRNGYRVAIAKVNENGGIKVDGKTYNLALKLYNDESNPAIAAKSARRLIKRDKALVLLGPYSSSTTATVAAVAEKLRVPLVQANGASLSLFDKGYKYQFAVLSTAEKYLSGALSLAAEAAKRNGGDPSKLKVGIAIEPDSFSRDLRSGVVKKAKELGMSVVLDEKLPRDFKDMTFILDKVKTSKPDILVVSGHEMGASLAIKQIKEQKIDVPMLAMSHCEGADIHGLYGLFADHTICATQWASDLNYQGVWFGSAHNYKRAFEAEYGYSPPYQAAESSAAVLVVADAIKRAGALDREKIRSALAETNVQTFFGRIKFDEQGRNVAKPMVLRQLVQGRYLLVAPAQFASHKLVFPRPKWSER
ncbi:MAG: amino acid ABC transporter substrate-binding protein [Rhodospirillales bacterium]|nr:amino acid ABC transporter substrate-binding protein [Alphaproteobacteria bacterium]MBL6948706.1 amino acid ABC transporter substrate-binding protein [Rhodospirillales bacterium]